MIFSFFILIIWREFLRFFLLIFIIKFKINKDLWIFTFIFFWFFDTCLIFLYIISHLSSKGISNLIVTDIRGLNYYDKRKYKTKVISSYQLHKSNFEIIKSVIKLFIGFFQFNILLFYNKPKNIITFGSYTSFIPIICTIIFFTHSM